MLLPRQTFPSNLFQPLPLQFFQTHIWQSKNLSNSLSCRPVKEALEIL
jgi:hypothetical protein